MKRYVLYIPYENVCFVWNYMPMWKYAFLKQLNYAALCVAIYRAKRRYLFHITSGLSQMCGLRCKANICEATRVPRRKISKETDHRFWSLVRVQSVACMFRVTRNGGINNHIVKHCLQTNHHINSAECIIRCTEYYQGLTLESSFNNLEQTPLNRANNWQITILS